MFSRIFILFVKYFVKYLLRLKVTFFNPPIYTSLSSIMAHQAAIFTRLVLRLDASQGEYESGTISLAFPKQRYAYLWTVSNWIADFTGFLVFFGFFPTYSRIIGVALGFENYETLAFTYLVYLFLELIWLSQLGPILSQSSRNAALDFLYSYVDSSKDSTLDLSKAQKIKLIQTFNQMQIIVRRYLGAIILGFLVHILPLPVIFIRSIGPYGLGLAEVAFYIFLSINSLTQGCFSLIFSFTLASQGFLLVRLLKFKLINSMRLLRRATPLSLRNFTVAYLSLNREIRQYNTFLSKYIFMTDLNSKLSGSSTLIFFYNSSLLFSNPFALTALVFIGGFYLSMNGILCFFSVFPEENLKAYRKLSQLYVRMHLGARRVNLKLSRSRLRGQRSTDVRQALQVNGLLQFLASRQFGFTYASQYVIEKKSVLENVLNTGIYFLLFLKRRV